MANLVEKQTGLNLTLEMCNIGPNNKACPIDKNGDKKSFFVVINNPSNKENKQFARIKLPSSNYKV